MAAACVRCRGAKVAAGGPRTPSWSRPRGFVTHGMSFGRGGVGGAGLGTMTDTPAAVAGTGADG